MPRTSTGLILTPVRVLLLVACLGLHGLAQQLAAAPGVLKVPVRIAAGPEWGAVDLSNSWPLKGSALDLSRFVDHAPAGACGRVIRTPEGHFNGPALFFELSN